jgi:hypothetical protein
MKQVRGCLKRNGFDIWNQALVGSMFWEGVTLSLVK